jgi:predicted RNase H-like nuclease (RuvC/YqgF family)
MTYWLILPLGLVCVSCSPKNNEQKQEQDQTASSTVSQEQAEAPHSEEIKKLKQENDELRKAMAEALPFLDEVKQLRRENDELKKAVSEIPALKKGLARLKQENEALKNAVAKATATSEVLNNALADATKTKSSGNESYRKYTDKSQRKAAALLAKFDSASSVKEKLEFIESLSELAFKQDPSVISVVRKALADPNSKVAHAAIELLEDYETPEILPAIEQALKLADEQIRIAAVETLSAVNDPQVIQLLAQALNDTSAEVRAAAIEVVQEYDSDPIKLSIMEKAIISPYDDVKYEAVSMLEDRSDHTAVELLIEGLKDRDPKFREEINETLSFLIDQEFETYEEALTWWTKNKDKYDDELIRIDDEV